MTTKKDAWIAAYIAGLQMFYPNESISAEKSHKGAIALAKRAVWDFETAFPDQPKTEGDFIKIPIKFMPEDDFIKIPRKDANGFELPEWVKPGAKCFHQGHIRIIDFVGVDEMKAWCCRLGYNGDSRLSEWAFVSNLKPYNG